MESGEKVKIVRISFDSPSLPLTLLSFPITYRIFVSGSRHSNGLSVYGYLCSNTPDYGVQA